VRLRLDRKRQHFHPQMMPISQIFLTTWGASIAFKSICEIGVICGKTGVSIQR
jgi:hypothetical protein